MASGGPLALYPRRERTSSLIRMLPARKEQKDEGQKACLSSERVRQNEINRQKDKLNDLCKFANRTTTQQTNNDKNMKVAGIATPKCSISVTVSTLAL